MSVRHLAAGSNLPELSEGTLRLYSMKYCPYAQRTRLVLAHKDITYELVNVNLCKKPDWLLERNPLGKVPILEHDGCIVYDSVICNDYLDDIYSQNKLYPDDPYDKARMKILIERFSKVVDLIGKLFFKLDSTGCPEVLYKALIPYEEALKGNFFGGVSISMLDLHMWPFIELFQFLQLEFPFEFLPDEHLPKLAAWSRKMADTPAAQATMTDMKYIPNIAKADRHGTMPDYDAGLED